MKKLFTLSLLLLCLFLQGQNIIENGNFDSYSTCPSDQGQLSLADGWMNLAIGTPDFFNECSDSSFIDVPRNNWGYQQSYDGNGYSGIYASQVGSDVNVREYLSTKLNVTLEAGVRYDLQFQISLADICNNAVASIGAHFSSDSLLALNGYIMNRIPQIEYSGEVLTDSINWITISGSFIADGSEKYLSIGNFKDDENSGLIQLEAIGPQAFNDFAYYYVDNIVLTESTSSTHVLENSSYKVFPNPCNDLLYIQSIENQLNQVFIYNQNSEILVNQTFFSSYKLDARNIPEGIYYYIVRNERGQFKKGRFVKTR